MTLLTVSEVAAALGVSERTVWREIHDGRLRKRKIRGRTFITQRELDAYLAHIEGRRVA